jgi:metal-responsive CopG/Arc/MetJ family transcriptional regulator
MAWPTTNNPRKNFVTMRFTDDEAADIDYLMARTSARDRSKAVRAAVNRVVAAERRKEAREQEGRG